MDLDVAEDAGAADAESVFDAEAAVDTLPPDASSADAAAPDASPAREDGAIVAAPNDAAANDAASNDAAPLSPGDAGPTPTPISLDDTSQAGLDPGVLAALRQGGPSCAAELLYPYNGAVFPRGLRAPPFMWSGATDAALLHLSSADGSFEYVFAAGASSPGELRIPQARWEEIGRQHAGGELRVRISTQQGSVLSTCERRLRVAPGVVSGSVYYDTYNHPASAGVAAVLRLSLGTAAPQVYLNELGISPMGPCVSCHSLSARGGLITAASHLYFPASFTARSYVTGSAPQPSARGSLPDATFGAITPDGSAILRMGNPDCTAGAHLFPRSKNNFPFLIGPTTAALIDSSTDLPIATSGLTPEHYMWMPQFSADGRKVVFNDAKPDGSGGTNRRELAVMDYDPDTHAFSNLRVIFTRAASVGGNYAPAPTPLSALGDVLTPVPGNMCSSNPSPGQGELLGASCTGPCYPAWPAFTPDGKGVVFSLISEPDFSIRIPGRDRAAQSELWYVDLDSQAAARLDNANRGRDAGEALTNYYPSVLPVAVGGYSWLFWTSTRDFGHRSLSPPDAALTHAVFGSAPDMLRKRIWVAALRPRASGGTLVDPSVPGFYLEGQSETGNTRPIATLNPCRATGAGCGNGLDCCSGYCDVPDSASAGTCVAQRACAAPLDKCTEHSECCPAAPGQPVSSCIDGVCNFLATQ